jgi:hypothetical protein
MAFDLTPSKNAKGRYSHQSGTPSSASGHRQDSSPSDGQEADRLSKHHHPRRHGGYSTQNAHSRAMVPDNRRAAERDDPKETDTYTSEVITCKDFVPTTKKFTRTEKDPATRPSTSRTGTNKKPIRATEEVASPKKVPAHRSDTSHTDTSKELVLVRKKVARLKKAPPSRSDIEYSVQRQIEHNKSPKSDHRPGWTRPRLEAAKNSKSGKGLRAERDLVDPRRTPSSKVKQTPVSDSQVQQETSVEPARTHRGPTSSIEMHTLRAPYPMGMGPSHGK